MAINQVLTDEQLDGLEVWAALSDHSEVTLALEELRRQREFQAELTLVGYVQNKAWNRMDNQQSRFCAMYPVHNGVRSRPAGCVAVYARRENGVKP
ncbi:hypothetical protein K9692_004663 [Escherichia coli]|jgi:hypothetical protein|uniref:hypothetical protein n=1 Tax=Buttiauxella gaviniae TaxID=82990 RepID=UPI001DD27E86|nr:hypothetical protein [Escherichia coli]